MFYSHGWCAVCDPEALAPGDPGYCGVNETNYGTEIPSVDETSLLWGFCQADCGRKGDSLADILKVNKTKTEIYTYESCLAIWIVFCFYLFF